MASGARASSMESGPEEAEGAETSMVTQATASPGTSQCWDDDEDELHLHLTSTQSPADQRASLAETQPSTSVGLLCRGEKAPREAVDNRTRHSRDNDDLFRAAPWTTDTSPLPDDQDQVCPPKNTAVSTVPKKRPADSAEVTPAAIGKRSRFTHERSPRTTEPCEPECIDLESSATLDVADTGESFPITADQTKDSGDGSVLEFFPDAGCHDTSSVHVMSDTDTPEPSRDSRLSRKTGQEVDRDVGLMKKKPPSACETMTTTDAAQVSNLRLPDNLFVSKNKCVLDTHSDTIFTQVQSNQTSSSSATEGDSLLTSSLALSGSSNAHRSHRAGIDSGSGGDAQPYHSNQLADDEATQSSVKEVSVNSSSSSKKPLQTASSDWLKSTCSMEESPNLSVSPIEHEVQLKKQKQKRRNQGHLSNRKTSTPGRERPPLDQVGEEAPAFPSSDENEETGEAFPTVALKRHRKKNSPQKELSAPPTVPFKVPNLGAVTGGGVADLQTVFVVFSANLSPPVRSQIKELLPEDAYIGEFQTPKEKFLDIQKCWQDFMLQLDTCSAGAGAGAPSTSTFSRNRYHRVSDATTLSSKSTSSSGTISSLGYVPDCESGASSILSGNGGSKRDRLSTLPEAQIPPSLRPAPLPMVMNKHKNKKECSSSRGNMGKDFAMEESADINSKSADIAAKANFPNADLDKASRVAVGEQVFAKFIERSKVNYWPATVQLQLDEYRWQVEFEEDQVRRSLRTEDLIPAKCLAPGDSVNVCQRGEDSGVFRTGNIVRYPALPERGPIPFHVRLGQLCDNDDDEDDSEDRVVPHTDIFLTADMAKAIISYLGGAWADSTAAWSGKEARSDKQRARGADISLDNLLMTKRRRPRVSTLQLTPVRRGRGRGRGLKKTEVPPLLDQEEKGRKKGGNNVETSAQETEVDETLSASSLSRTRKEAAVIEKLPITSTDEALSEENVKSSTKVHKRKTNVKKIKDNSGLFAKRTFILTQSRHEKDPLLVRSQPRLESETEESELDRDEDDPECEHGLRFNRVLLTRLLTNHGGAVLSDFPGEKQHIPQPPEGLVVITDRCCRTMTFLLAITYGFPRVNFQWVHDSIRLKQVQSMKNYYVPVGYSLTLDTVIEYRIPHPANFPDSLLLTRLFAGHTLLLASTDAHFIMDWKALLTRLGASVCSRKKGRIDRQMGKISLVVADDAEGKGPSSVLEDARKKNIAVVSSKWIIESLINAKWVEPDKFII